MKQKPHRPGRTRPPVSARRLRLELLRAYEVSVEKLQRLLARKNSARPYRFSFS